MSVQRFRGSGFKVRYLYQAKNLAGSLPGRLSCVVKLEWFYPVIWKEQVVLVVGAASSRDHLISRLEAAPTGSFFMVTWTFRLSALFYLKAF